MILLNWSATATSPGKAVLLFGLGLVGSAVHRALQRSQPTSAVSFGYDWQSEDTRSRQLNTIESAVADLAGQGIGQLDIVWTGGRSGFGSTVEDMTREYEIVARISECAQRLCRKMPQTNHGFHLLSSAGGLFEGCRHATIGTAPAPLRPYGHGKLAQEELVHRLPDALRRRIYRPGSVYGYAPNGRAGLITTLIANGLRSRSTGIFGKVDTLRDYVSADDIGGFIAQNVISPSKTATSTSFLVTGHAASMHEVVHLVEKAVGRSLYLQFDPRPHNASDITFLKSALPAHWHPAPLNIGIAQLVMKLSGQ